MSPQSLALYLAAATALTLSPGPDILTVLTRSITQGRAAGLVASLGFATGLVAHTTAAALGLALLLQNSPSALLLVRLAGVLYLLYLALRILLGRDPVTLDQTSSARAPARSLVRIYGQSILMNILNPKVTLFFLAFLPQFVDPRDALPLPAQFILLGALFALVTVVCFGSVALLASALSARLRQNPRLARPLRYATAALFLLIAARLALP